MEFDIKKFADLARVKITEKESKKIGGDLQGILDYFAELQELDTKKVTPMTGGTELKNVFRDDESSSHRISGGGEQFQETKDGYLKVPKIFE